MVGDMFRDPRGYGVKNTRLSEEGPEKEEATAGEGRYLEKSYKKVHEW